MTDVQVEQAWDPFFKSKEHVCCSWNDKEGTKLLTITD